jgi:amino acid permease
MSDVHSGRGSRRRFVQRAIIMLAVVAPISFGFGYASGGTTGAFGAFGTTLGLFLLGAIIFALRHLVPPRR